MDMNNIGIRTIIVDDEPKCVTNLSYYLQKYCPDIDIVTTATTLPEAAAAMAAKRFQLAFLDVEFCDSTIFSLLQDPGKIDFSIVFVTAYDRYAVKAFKVEALDYILKPLSKHDILQCYHKITRSFGRKPGMHNIPAAAVPNGNNGIGRKVILRDREHMFIVDQNDIFYLKAMGAYTEVVFLAEGKMTTVLVSKTLAALEEEYNNPVFFRIHKSYLINLKKVTGIQRKEAPVVEMINRARLPVAKRRIHDLLSFLNDAG
jgi:two-component system, LytTR family, response regulator